MPRRYTEAFKTLEWNLNRTETLLQTYFDNPGGHPRARGQPNSTEQELLRAVLVLAVGTLDAFLSQLVAETLPDVAEKPTAGEVFNSIARENPGLVLRALFLGEEERSDALNAAVEAQLVGRPMHGKSAVMTAARWCALELTSHEVDAACGLSDVMEKLDGWTQTRHDIVHRGQRPRLGRYDVGDLAKSVREIARLLNDKVIDAYG